jgi:hypothetical protein
MNLDPNNTPTKQKKVWEKPEFYILDTDEVNTNKSLTTVHEKTGHQNGNRFYTKSNNYYFFGTIKQAIS